MEPLLYTARLATESCWQGSCTWHCRRHLSVGRETAWQPLLLLGSPRRRRGRLRCWHWLPSVASVTVHALENRTGDRSAAITPAATMCHLIVIMTTAACILLV